MSLLVDDPGLPDRETFSAYLAVNGYADATIRNYTALFVRWVDWCTTEGVSPTLCAAGDVRAWSRTVHGSRSVLAQARGMIHHLCTMVGVARPTRRRSSDHLAVEELALIEVEVVGEAPAKSRPWRDVAVDDPAEGRRVHADGGCGFLLLDAAEDEFSLDRLWGSTIQDVPLPDRHAVACGEGSFSSGPTPEPAGAGS